MRFSRSVLRERDESKGGNMEAILEASCSKDLKQVKWVQVPSMVIIPWAPLVPGYNSMSSMNSRLVNPWVLERNHEGIVMRNYLWLYYKRLTMELIEESWVVQTPTWVLETSMVIIPWVPGYNLMSSDKVPLLKYHEFHEFQVTKSSSIQLSVACELTSKEHQTLRYIINHNRSQV